MFRPAATLIGLALTTAMGTFVVADEPSLNSPQAQRSAEHAVVLHAAGAVEVILPDGWQVWEAARGREIRLVLSPSAPDAAGDLQEDGVWLTYHVRALRAADERSTYAELDELLARRARLATDNRAMFGRRTALHIGPWPAVKQEFNIVASDNQENGVVAEQTGFHILARTTWGICELHAVTRSAWMGQRAEQFDRIVADLTLRSPTYRQQTLDYEVREAAPIIGTWRSFRSQVKLTGNGRIEISPDKQLTQRIAIQSPEVAVKKAEVKYVPLTGRFEARGDVLIVLWDDGSRLNYRWKLADDELLLTDHDGQISQLRRILE